MNSGYHPLIIQSSLWILNGFCIFDNKSEPIMNIYTGKIYRVPLFFLMKRLILFFVFYYGTMVDSFSQDHERIVMIYQETVCPPEWSVFQSDTATFYNLKQLFKKDSVHIFEIKHTGKLHHVMCEACGCLTGRNIEITIRRKDQQKSEALGFKRPWIWMVKAEKACDWTIGLDDQQIRQKLLKKKIRALSVFVNGMYEKTSTDCAAKSGRTLSIKVDCEDLNRAISEGYSADDTMKEY
jgi:hypothetical protein